MHNLIIDVAKYGLVLSAILGVLAWWPLARLKKRDFIILATASGVLALLLAKLGSKLYYDPRPFVVSHFTPYFSHAKDNGFPSDHTLLTAWLAFVTLYFNRRYGVIALVVAVLVGAARVVAGVHHLADIVGSIVFAGLAVALCSYAQQKWQARHDEVSTQK